MPTSKPVRDISDPRWQRAISHPIRVRLLAMLDEESASPVILAAKLNQPLGTVAYHVRTLFDLGLLKLVRTRQRRGATEHYYRAVGLPRGFRGSSEELDQDAWAALDPVSKQRVLTALLARANDLAAGSAAAGGFDDGRARVSMSRLKLDRKGWAAVGKEATKLLTRLQQIEQEAAVRLAKAPESAIDTGLTLMLFQTPPSGN